jgi:hypothetical protein
MNEDESQQVKYILDTNVLFELAIWISPKLNKPFWVKMHESLRDGKWVLLDVIVEEIRRDGDLKKWCKEMKSAGLVTEVTSQQRLRGVEINNAYKIINDATQQSQADVYLIAFAEENKLCIFTRERNKRHNEELYKIPDVCDQLNVNYIRTPEDFYEAMGFRF